VKKTTCQHAFGFLDCYYMQGRDPVTNRRRSGHRISSSRGDVDGSAVWRRILAAIEELQRGPREDEAVN